ncbi:MAG: hypothetical protein AB8G95_01115 [Anaerolineae bacterium]
MFKSKMRSLPDGYVEIIVNPSKIWKASANMIYWPTLTRIRSYLELHRYPLFVGSDENTLVIEADSGRFEITVQPQLSLGRGSRSVPITMGPFTPDTPQELHDLKAQIADLFVKGKKVNWKGPEDLKGWWDE